MFDGEVGTWKLHHGGELWWSEEMYRLLGRDPTLRPPVWHDLEPMFSAKDWQRLNAGVQLVQASGSAVRMDVELKGSRTRRWLVNEIAARGSSSGRIVQGTTRDVTEQKAAEQRLLETEKRFRTIANSAPVMIWMAARNSGRIYFNEPWLQFTGRPLEAELGTGWTEGIHPEDSSCLEAYSRSFTLREEFRLQYRLRRYDGIYRWIRDHGVPRITPRGDFLGYMGSCIDETEQRNAEEALRTVGGRLLEAQEEERRHIARELHDGVSQQIAMLSVELEQLKKRRLPPRALVEQLDRLSRHTTAIASDIEELSHRLHSARLEYLGLIPALRGFCEEVAEHQKVKVKLVHDAVPSMITKDVALGLFRIAQEALHNAVKHSHAKAFEVRVSSADGAISLSVRDSGVGFDYDEAMHGKGLGLISMRERVKLLNGTVVIESHPKQGTEVIARVPLAA